METSAHITHIYIIIFARICGFCSDFLPHLCSCLPRLWLPEWLDDSSDSPGTALIASCLSASPVSASLSAFMRYCTTNHALVLCSVKSFFSNLVVLSVPRNCLHRLYLSALSHPPAFWPSVEVFSFLGLIHMLRLSCLVPFPSRVWASTFIVFQ